MKVNLESSWRKWLLLLMGATPLATVATCVPNGNGGTFFFSSSGNFIEDTLDELEDIFDD